MSSLYPSLEDMQCHKIIQAQESAFAQYQRPATQAMPSAPPSYPAPSQLGYPDLTIPKEASYPSAPTSASVGNATVTELYPGLADFMGLELSEEMIAANMPEYLRSNQVAMPSSNYMMPSPNVSGGLIAPLSGQSVGLQRAQVTHGIRELTLCKDADKKVGLRVKDINNGVFVTVVVKGSPAALAGLRFGDQILQINGTTVAGMNMDAIHKIFRKSPKNNISIVVRDRPFERTVTMHKDSLGHVGFQFNNGKITTIVKDSSAARNGLLIDHQLLEVNGQNVVGMKDKEVIAIINQAEQIITVTIIPSFIYDHMMKKLSSSFIRGIMDHSLPDF